MEPPHSERLHTPYFRPNRQRRTSELKTKVEVRQNCPHRIARPELNYNLASLGGGKNGVGQSWTVRDSLLLTSQERPLNLYRSFRGLSRLQVIEGKCS